MTNKDVGTRLFMIWWVGYVNLRYLKYFSAVIFRFTKLFINIKMVIISILIEGFVRKCDIYSEQTVTIVLCQFSVSALYYIMSVLLKILSVLSLKLM